LRTKKALVAIVLIFLVTFGAGSSIYIVKCASVSTPQIQWHQSLGEGVGRSIVAMDDGGYLVLVMKRSLNSGAGSNPQSITLASSLIRTDRQGNLLWQKDIQAGEGMTINSLLWTNESLLASNYIPATSGIPITSGIALAGSNSTGTYLFSLDLGATIQWIQPLNGTYGGYVNSMVQTSDQGFALVGTHYSTSSSSQAQIWCIKTNILGNQTWNATIGSLGTSATSILETSDGGYAVIATQCTPGSNHKALKIMKLDPTGTVEWTKTYTAPVQGDVQWAASSNDGILTRDRGYLIAGTLSSLQNGTTYAWMVKTDSLGNLEWNKTIGNENGYISSIMQTADGGYGFSGSLDGQNVCVAKTDAYGNMEWYSTFPGLSLINPGKTIAQADDNGYVILGTENGTLTIMKLEPDTFSNRATIGVTATEGGTTRPVPGTYIYNASTQISFEAKPDAGYKFEKWISGTEEFTFNPLVFTTANGTYYVEAVFVASNESSSPGFNFDQFILSPLGAAVIVIIVFIIIATVTFFITKRKGLKSGKVKQVEIL
jgi:hypothetical protein